MNRAIEKGWQSYQRLVVPSDASDIQISETRQAFFAGAAILFQALTNALDPDPEPTAGDLKRMEDLQAELDEFGAALDCKFLPEH